MLAHWAHQGVIGQAVLHRLKADEAVGAFWWSFVSVLLRAVLPTEGPGGRWKAWSQ